MKLNREKVIERLTERIAQYQEADKAAVAEQAAKVESTRQKALDAALRLNSDSTPRQIDKVAALFAEYTGWKHKRLYRDSQYTITHLRDQIRLLKMSDEPTVTITVRSGLANYL